MTALVLYSYWMYIRALRYRAARVTLTPTRSTPTEDKVDPHRAHKAFGVLHQVSSFDSSKQRQCIYKEGCHDDSCTHVVGGGVRCTRHLWCHSSFPVCSSDFMLRSSSSTLNACACANGSRHPRLNPTHHSPAQGRLALSDLRSHTPSSGELAQISSIWEELRVSASSEIPIASSIECIHGSEG